MSDEIKLNKKQSEIFMKIVIPELIRIAKEEAVKKNEQKQVG